jgi:hypothetical protein
MAPFAYPNYIPGNRLGTKGLIVIVMQLHAMFGMAYLAPGVILAMKFSALRPRITLEILLPRLESRHYIAGIQCLNTR